MHRSYTLLITALLGWGIVCCLGQAEANSQVAAPKVPGIFVNPVPGAPFSAKVELISKQTLPDGSVFVLKTVDSIARDSEGRTRTEARRFVADSYAGEPPISRIYIYDPVAGISTRLDPFELTAKQTRTNTPPSRGRSIPLNPNDPNHSIKETDLGTRAFKNLTLRGIRQSRSEDDFDDYWYSPDLSIYMIRKHQDPNWEQTVTVAEFDRLEPDPTRFAVADSYKIVAEPEVSQRGPYGQYNAGDEVLHPQLLYAPDPEYTDEARRAKVSGVVIVSLVVDVEGKPTNLRIIKHLEMGLDDRAIAAVKQYKFRPATLHGKPVPVEVNIQVAFKIY